MKPYTEAPIQSSANRGRQDILAAGQRAAFELALAGSPLEKALEVLARTAREQQGDCRAAIFLLNADGTKLEFCAGIGLAESFIRAIDFFPIGPQQPTCGWAAHVGQTSIVEDVESDARCAPYLSLAREHGIRSCWSQPVKIVGGQVHGMITLYHPVPRRATEEDIDALKSIGQAAAVLIGWHRAEEGLRERKRRLEVLERLGELSRTVTDSAAITIACMDVLRSELNADRCVWVEVEEDQSHFSFGGAAFAPEVPRVSGRYPISAFGSECLAALRAGKQFVCSDALDELPEGGSREAYSVTGIRAMIASPIVREGRLVAGTGVHCLSPRSWTSEEVHLVQTVTERCWESIERAKAERALRQREEQLRIAAEAAHVGTWSMDVETGQVYWSPELRSLMGFDADEPASTERALAMIHPEDREQVQALWQRVISLQEGPEFRHEFRAVRPDGEVRWVEERGKASFDPGAGVPRCVAGVLIDVTERKRSEEVIRDSEQRFRMIADSMPVMVFSTDSRGNADYVNRGWIDYTQLSLKQCTSAGWLNAVHPDDRERTIQSWAEAVKRQEGWEEEYRVRRASDGAWRWQLVRGFPLKGASGEIIKWLGTYTDIHERREVEQRLLELSEQLRFHVENTPLAVVEFRAPEHTVSGWSKQAEVLFGWTAEEIIGRKLADIPLVHPDDREVVAKVAEEMESGKRLRNVNANRNRTKDGRVIDCQWYNSARLGPDGKLSSVFSLVLDVTQRNENERALAQSEARFRRLVETSIFGVALGKFTGDILYVNDAFLKMIGYSREEFESKGVKWTDLTPPEYLPLDLAAVEELRATGHATPFEKEYIHKDGSRVPILIGGALLNEPYESQDTMVGFYIDLTEIKRTQRELERSNEELQRFAYTASHDLQEPIRTVVNFTQLIARQYTGKLSPQTNQHISFILEAANRMSKLISSLLAYSQVSELPQLQRTEVDLNRVLDLVLKTMCFSIEDSEAQIISQTLPVVAGDEQLLIQLLQNLIGNAIKYRKPDVPPRIELTVELQGGRDWLFRLQDNGVGFHPQYAELIFGVFKRLHGRDFSGTGIGLSICRKIVERHGGRIWATAEEGKGATFHFTLPASET
jgi:PAS domain S-box-containing protein